MWWPLHDDSLVSAGNPLGDRPPRSPGVDPKQLAAELQKVSQQQAPTSASTSGLPATTSTTSSPGQPGSPSVSKKRHSSKVSSGGGGLFLKSSLQLNLAFHFFKWMMFMDFSSSLKLYSICAVSGFQPFLKTFF